MADRDVEISRLGPQAVQSAGERSSSPPRPPPADITYATNNELGFDYLRDNMKYSRAQMVQRPFNFAIVDEVDSILIDEARTPLIISGPTDDKSDLYMSVDALVKTFTEADYEKDEKQKTVVLTEDGTEKAERMLEEQGLIEGQWEHPERRTRRFYSLTKEGRREHRRLLEEVRPFLESVARSIDEIVREVYGP